MEYDELGMIATDGIEQPINDELIISQANVDPSSTEQSENINLDIIHQGIDYSTYTLLDLAIMAESEITGQSIVQFKEALRLQMIVLKSQLKSVEQDDVDKLNSVLKHVYQTQGFSGDWKAFFKVKNVLISKVLSRRKGVPISLGILLIEMLKETGIKAQGICFPSGFIVKIELDNNFLYIDPFNGELVDFSQLELKVRGQLGNHARLESDMLQADSKETIIKRYVNVLKASYIQSESIELALLCSDILLRLDPDDAFEVRDRGFLFQQLECYQLACNDFTYFIEQRPEDPIVNFLKQQIIQMGDELRTQIIH